MDNQAFTDLLAGLDESAAVETEAPASAEVETAPLLDSAPTQPETDAPAPDQPASDTVPTPPLLSPNWNSPDNPYLTQAQQLAAQQQMMAAQQQAWEEQQRQMALWQQQQQQAQRYQELDSKWREIAGGDLEAYDTIRASVAELTQPYMQQAQAVAAEADYAKRLATAIHIAAQAYLGPDQQQALNANVRHFLSMQSPDQMLADVQYRQALAQQSQSELSRLQQENLRLRQAQQAQAQVQSRLARGADAVEQTGTAALPNTDTFADFDDLFNRVIGAA